MKKLTIVFAAFVVGAVMVSCDKFPAKTDGPSGEEYVLKIDDGTFDAHVDTKGDRITSVPGSLYVGRSTGSPSSEASISAPASKTVSAGSISTGFYMPTTPVTYNWYVSNQNFSITASGGSINIGNNNTDVLTARVSSSSTSVDIQLNHVFACLKTLTATGINGYSISGVSWKIKPSGANCGTAGTYNMNTGAWTSTTAIPGSGTSVSSDSYMFLIPGTYVIEVSYTATKGDYVENLTKSATVTLERSMYNNITANLDGSATEITLNLSVEAWGTNNMTPPFS